MQTELVFATKLANNTVAYCENFLQEISIFDVCFTTRDPFTSRGKTVEEFSSAEEDAQPGSPATTIMTRTRGAGKKEWEY